MAMTSSPAPARSACIATPPSCIARSTSSACCRDGPDKLGVREEAAITQLSERHEVRVRAQNGTIVFVADSQDGRLVIRQECDDHREGRLRHHAQRSRRAARVPQRIAPNPGIARAQSRRLWSIMLAVRETPASYPKPPLPDRVRDAI